MLRWYLSPTPNSYYVSPILAQCENIDKEGNGTFSIQIPECQVNSTNDLIMDNLTLSRENWKYLKISSINLPKKNEVELIFKMKSDFDYDKVHKLNCFKPGFHLTTYRNLTFKLKEPKNFNVQMASSLGLL